MQQIECAWCKKHLGEQQGEGVSHGICPECFAQEIKNLEEIESTQALDLIENRV